eukprot:COSAG01_NODE_59818_length_298_cov_0.718593_1_plen_54_part_00
MRVETARQADSKSAALLWFCSQRAEPAAAAERLATAAELVSGSAFLWEMAAAA